VQEKRFLDPVQAPRPSAREHDGVEAGEGGPVRHHPEGTPGGPAPVSEVAATLYWW
jgi:hypothetical protein